MLTQRACGRPVHGDELALSSQPCPFDGRAEGGRTRKGAPGSHWGREAKGTPPPHSIRSILTAFHLD